MTMYRNRRTLRLNHLVVEMVQLSKRNARWWKWFFFLRTSKTFCFPLSLSQSLAFCVTFLAICWQMGAYAQTIVRLFFFSFCFSSLTISDPDDGTLPPNNWVHIQSQIIHACYTNRKMFNTKKSYAIRIHKMQKRNEKQHQVSMNSVSFCQYSSLSCVLFVSFNMNLSSLTIATHMR